MPFNPDLFRTFTPGDALTAGAVNLTSRGLSEGLNGGLTLVDFEDKPDATGSVSERKKAVINSAHIYKPEFYGSPSPHVLAVSSDTYYRRRSGNKLNRYYRHEGIGSQTMDKIDISKAFEDISAWQPVEGLSATVHIEDVGYTPTVLVSASFHAQEKGGKVGDPRSQILREGRDTGEGNSMESLSGYYRAIAASRYVAGFGLFLDKMDGSGPTYIVGTQRWLFGTGGGRYRCRRMNHAINVMLNDSGSVTYGLTPGENKISVRCFYRLFSPSSKFTRHVYVDARNLVVDVIYK